MFEPIGKSEWNRNFKNNKEALEEFFKKTEIKREDLATIVLEEEVKRPSFLYI